MALSTFTFYEYFHGLSFLALFVSTFIIFGMCTSFLINKILQILINSTPSRKDNESQDSINDDLNKISQSVQNIEESQYGIYDDLNNISQSVQNIEESLRNLTETINRINNVVWTTEDNINVLSKNVKYTKRDTLKKINNNTKLLEKIKNTIELVHENSNSI